MDIGIIIIISTFFIFMAIIAAWTMPTKLNEPDTILIRDKNMTDITLTIEQTDSWASINAIVTPISVATAAFLGAFFTRYYTAQKTNTIRKSVTSLVKKDLEHYKSTMDIVTSGKLIDNDETYFFKGPSNDYKKLMDALPIVDRYFSNISLELRAQIFPYEVLEQLSETYKRMSRFQQSVRHIEASDEYRIGKTAADNLQQSITDSLKLL